MTLTRFQSRPTGPEEATPRDAPRLHVVTFGCQMNKYDSQLVEGRFRRRGYRLTERAEDADVLLFNTCSVRDHAEERVYSWLGELKRAKDARPDLVLGVMGCMAQRVGEEIARRAAHVDVVCGTRQLQNMPELVDTVRRRRADPDGHRDREQALIATGMDSDVAVDRSGESYVGGRHGFLAVMRGCNLNCTFCVVPRTRGRVISRPIEDLVREARWMVDQGCQVITLLGQTVNSYGEDFPVTNGTLGAGASGAGRAGRPGLADLLDRLQEIEGLERIRLVTLHPSYVTEPLARALRDNDKCDRFLPLPVQSGSDRILRAMKRGYTTDLYRRRVDLLRSFVPDIELGTDWIVGFPGEEESDFQASIDLLREQRFVVNYVFKYDARPDTAANERFEDTLTDARKKERNRLLLAAGEDVSRQVLEGRIGTVQEVFVEERDERPRARGSDQAGSLRGRTPHNLPVAFPGGDELLGTRVKVLVQQASPYGMAGILEGSASAPNA